jgi:hypothetical protein
MNFSATSGCLAWTLLNFFLLFCFFMGFAVRTVIRRARRPWFSKSRAALIYSTGSTKRPHPVSRKHRGARILDRQQDVRKSEMAPGVVIN